MASRKRSKRQSVRRTTGGKSNRYIEPQIYPKNLADGVVAKGKDKQYWQIKNGAWMKPSGVTQIALKKIYYLQLKKKAEFQAKKQGSARKSKSTSRSKTRSRKND